MNSNSSGPHAPLSFACAYFLLFTAYTWFGRAMTSCDSVEFCTTGFVHAAYSAAAYVMTAALAVLLIRIVYVYRSRKARGAKSCLSAH